MNLQDFNAYLELRNRSKETRYRYVRMAKLYLDSKGDYSPESVSTFVRKLNGGEAYKRWAWQALRTFFRFADKTWPFEAHDGPQVHKAPNRPFLTEEQARGLLEAAKADPLDYALFRVACLSGARRAELADLTIAHYRPEIPGLRIDTRKNGIPRQILIDTVTKQAIERWLDVRGRKAGPLFVWNDEGVSPQWISTRFRTYRDKLGLPKGAGLHAIRRGAITWSFKRGMTEKELQEWGGWRSPFMAHEYVQLEPGAVAEKALGASPFNEPEGD